jgi:hypothetical protein
MIRMGERWRIHRDVRSLGERDPHEGGGPGRRVFLELSPDEVLDPDLAVMELESMAYLLGQLSESEKRQLVAFTQAEANRVSSDDYRAFLRQFPKHVGL